MVISFRGRSCRFYEVRSTLRYIRARGYVAVAQAGTAGKK